MSYIITYQDVRVQSIRKILSHVIQHTLYLSSAGLLSRLSRPLTTHLLIGVLPRTFQTAYQPLLAMSWTATLPFTLLVGELVLL